MAGLDQLQSRTALTCLVLVGCVYAASAIDLYIGCYGDGPDRGLPTKATSTSAMSVAVCSNLATAAGQTVYGLVNNTCYIGKHVQLDLKAYLTGLV